MQWVDTLRRYNLRAGGIAAYAYVDNNFFSSYEIISGIGFCIGSNGNLFIRFAYVNALRDASVERRWENVHITTGRTTHVIREIEVNFYDMEDWAESILRHINFALTSIKCDASARHDAKKITSLINMTYKLIRDNADSIRICVDKTKNDIVKI